MECVSAWIPLEKRRPRRLYLGKMEMNLAAGAQEAEGAFEEHWKPGLRLGAASVGKVEGVWNRAVCVTHQRGFRWECGGRVDCF